MSSWETDWFTKLGNEIMFQAADEVDPIDPEEIKRLGKDTREKRTERMDKLVGNMKATTTGFSYGQYPWNSVSLILGTPACSTISGFLSYFRSQSSLFFPLSLPKLLSYSVILREDY